MITQRNAVDILATLPKVPLTATEAVTNLIAQRRQQCRQLPWEFEQNVMNKITEYNHYVSEHIELVDDLEQATAGTNELLWKVEDAKTLVKLLEEQHKESKEYVAQLEEETKALGCKADETVQDLLIMASRQKVKYLQHFCCCLVHHSTPT